VYPYFCLEIQSNKSEHLLLFGTALAKNHWQSQMIFRQRARQQPGAPLYMLGGEHAMLIEHIVQELEADQGVVEHEHLVLLGVWQG
jgi:hypothetical protein